MIKLISHYHYGVIVYGFTFIKKEEEIYRVYICKHSH